MIAKKELLSGLHELIHIEEGIITLYINFTRILLKRVKDMDQDMKDRLETSLAEIYADSTRHKQTVYRLVKKIRESKRDEY